MIREERSDNLNSFLPYYVQARMCIHTPHTHTLNYPSLTPTTPQIHIHTQTHIHTHSHTHKCVCAVQNVRVCISVISYRQTTIDRNVSYIYIHIIISHHTVLCTHFVAYFYKEMSGSTIDQYCRENDKYLNRLHYLYYTSCCLYPCLRIWHSRLRSIKNDHHYFCMAFMKNTTHTGEYFITTFTTSVQLS